MRFSSALLSVSVLIAAPAFGEPPKVVADIAPVHALLAQVMDGVAGPGLLLAQNANPHAVQLKPSQVRMLTGADLVVWVGPGLSPWLERIVTTEVGTDLALMEHPATHLRTFGGGDGAHDGHDGHDGHDDHDSHDHGGHDDHDGHKGHDDHEGHDHSGTDPHVWLDTANARAWLGVFAEELAQIDPDNAATYRANAEAAEARIDVLEARIGGRLAAYQGAGIITFHEAFGYFADRFGIGIVGSVRPGDASAPSAAALSDLRQLVADRGVECAFAEPGFDPGLIDAIAGETGLRVGTLDATGALQQPGPDHYAATLEAIAVSISDCLQGG
ncbi:MAG: hypothetical protein CSA74_06290 [Rhodobacterales bacterium]|nr:MAG: hypothetical protein CSA74_06290 [Rhodobacterales bacterium]